MKIIIKILIIFYIFPLYAEDISDFQINGISIGDSLLKYFDEKEILNEKLFEIEQKDNKEVAHILSPSESEYYLLKYSFKNDDNQYKIISLTGFVDINEDIEICYDKKSIIINDIKKYFNDLEIIEDPRRKHDFDDKSFIEGTIFVFPLKNTYPSFIRVQCYDWSKEAGYGDQLRVEIISDKYYEWLTKLYNELKK